jgi:ribosome biogenesis protein Nip4
VLDKRLIIKKQNRYFLLGKNMTKLVTGDFYHAGLYLGKAKGGHFFPSFPLLAMLSELSVSKVFVDDKAEWLFICGRDILGQGIVRTTGSCRKGNYALVLNQYGECLGFGRIVQDPRGLKDKHAVIVNSISDIGDFLRREK